MDVDIERIRLRAYEIWENEGRSGDPMEHWLRAQRELVPAPAANSIATVEAAAPADAAAAAEAIASADPVPKKAAKPRAPRASAAKKPA